VPVDPDDLADSIGRLDGIAPTAGLDDALELVVTEAVGLFPVDGSGLLLLGEGGALHYVNASDEPGRMLETLQEQTGEGPCIDAFLDDRPVEAVDLLSDARWPRMGRLAAEHGIRAVLGIPVDLRGGPVGTLNLYATRPHRWDDAEVAAIRAYGRVVASLLRSAADAHVKGRAAEQLGHALQHRVRIEQAKGILMERRRLDAQAAFDLLRGYARSTRRPLGEIARLVTSGASLPGLTGPP
jgi:GAF domain-containing protein